MERLTPEELEWQNKILTKLQEARAAFRIWEEHLRERYKLSDQDSVSFDGIVQRQNQQDSPAQQG